MLQTTKYLTPLLVMVSKVILVSKSKANTAHKVEIFTFKVHINCMNLYELYEFYGVCYIYVDIREHTLFCSVFTKQEMSV